jgi:hypothetical protein
MQCHYLHYCQSQRIWSAARYGLGRVELLIIFVLGVIVLGVLVSFVPRAREKANLLACANNLRQMGEAVYLFRDHQKPASLPASGITIDYASWAVQIAPFLDPRKTGALPNWDISQSYFEQPDDVRQAQVLMYYCPSRRSPPQNSSSGDVRSGGTENISGALSDYACAAGTGDPRYPWKSPKANGAIIPGEVTRWGPRHAIRAWRGRTDFAIDDPGSKNPLIRVRKGTGKPGALAEALKRGTSETILIGEKHVPWGQFGQVAHGDGSAYNGGRPASNARVGGPGHGLAQAVDTELDLSYPIFGSYHPDLVQFLMADDSVRGLTRDVDETLLGRLIVRDDEW